MTRNAALAELQNSLHVSHGQVFSYLACGLKYRFQYVERRPPERLSISLPFGKAIHASLERYYLSLQQGITEPLDILEDLFAEQLAGEIQATDVPVIFKKETQDLGSAITMGRNMLKVFHEEVDLGDAEVVAVELPLSATLYSGEARATEYQLVGVIDLLLRDGQGNLIVTDHKTAAQQKSQSAVDDDLQLTAYSYLLTAGGHAPALSNTRCRMDVLRKLKTPKFERYDTIRTARDRRRFAKIAEGALAGIDARIFVPTRGWLCSDCAHRRACEAW
ncbi:MAG: hypothetical protein CVU73_14550 [Deltaproteobacteria bacterium HGW-Deltaproteobacteria-8]|nr:MAG: hypothetical protein CVU73_14550 [Deltaproteobacteria bacterium HGW-Deltaproteobacteria-8]